jgi:protein-S-isoprenylcysteine O-methyltransferase Ste14
VKRIPPPVLALSAALAQRALTRGAQPPSAGRRAAAGAIAAASVGLAGSTVRLFRRSRTTLDPLDPARASALVTTGANSISRNPMYVGLAGLLVSNAIRRKSWAAILPVAGFVLVIDRFQVAPEEVALVANFGADYEAYRAAVPRWLGWRSLELRLGTTS